MKESTANQESSVSIQEDDSILVPSSRSYSVSELMFEQFFNDEIHYSYDDEEE